MGNYAHFLLFSYNNVDGAIDKARKAIEIMNYGNAQKILSYALYNKWAMLKDSPETASKAQKYFDEALSILPNLDHVIRITQQSEYTKL